MNRKYIKRQLTLNELGYPMDKDVQEYIDYFYEIIGNPKSLKKEYGEYYDIKGYMYFKNNNRLLFYTDFKTFFLNYHEIWISFKSKFKLRHKEEGELLCGLLESVFKCEVKTINFSTLN